MHKDHLPYYHFTSRARLEKSINTLIGIVEGISTDKRINDRERFYLRQWVADHLETGHQHPFNELLPVIEESLADNMLTEEERQGILWVCYNMSSQEYYDDVTSDIQQLHSIMGGIAADGIINEKELKGLKIWLRDHEHLEKCYPYDEVVSILSEVMADNRIDAEEQNELLRFFSEFVQVYDDKIVKHLPILEESSIKGQCAICPEIIFKDSRFCFTGASTKYSRKQFVDLVSRLEGKYTNSVTKDLDYLVIGADGNPCWAYACYGRKVQAAVNLRKQGYQLLIVHEHDFHDTVSDLLDE
jgi:hypothetical protein